MNREFSQQEEQIVLQAVEQLRAEGLIVNDVDGTTEVNHNAERIMAFFDLNLTIPVTVKTVLEACQQMKNQMKWKSRLQMEYEQLYNQLTKDQQDQFGGWWHSFSTKNTIVTEGEQGYQNAVSVLKWSKGRSLDSRTLDLAVSNLLQSRGMHLVPIREQVSSGRPGHTDDG